MGKFLFWLGFILLVLCAARIAGRFAKKRSIQPPPPSKLPETMVRCAHCGIHLPRSEAVLQQGQTWCSPAHARLGPSQL